MADIRMDERRGTRACAAYVRSSAYKAREVLDLIRGRGCDEAHDILAFSERDVARDISKVLHSAVSNAEHNDGLNVEELYVSACYADEGPTIKRWRARARGRGVRVRKRTCHIAVVVSRYDEEGLERLRSTRTTRLKEVAASAESRRRRVALSRGRQTANVSSVQAAADPDSEHDTVESTDVGELTPATQDISDAAMVADKPTLDRVDAEVVSSDGAADGEHGAATSDGMSGKAADADHADADHEGQRASDGKDR